MTPKEITPRKKLDAAELRGQAEKRLSERTKKVAASPATEVETQRLIHELEVHQIELEMQNDELMRSRAVLEEAYLKYSDLYDFAPVGYLTLARDGKINKINLAGANLLGMERDNLVQRYFELFVSSESHATFRIFLGKLLSGNGKENCELAFTKDDKQLLWTRVEATCFEDAQECRVAMIDITDRKRAEKRLSEGERRFRALVEHISDVVMLIDVEGHIIYSPPSVEFILGYTSTELKNRLVIEMIYPDDLAAFAASFAQVLSHPAGSASNIEIRVVRKDGSLRWVQVSSTNLLADSSVRAIILVYRDISERKNAES